MPEESTAESGIAPFQFGNLLSTVPKFDGTNYWDWKFAVSMVLRRAGCWEVVEGKTAKPKTRESGSAWEVHAQDGLTAIGLTVDPSQYAYIRDCTDGPTAWAALKDVYEKSSRANRISLKRQFYGFIHDTAASISVYINGILDLASKLRAIGVTLGDDDVTDVLIFNLDESWSNIAGSLSTRKENVTIADVRGALIDEEGRRTKGTGVYSAGDPPHNLAMVARQRSETHTCWVCGKRGHKARDCWKKKTGSQEENPEKRAGSRSDKVADRTNFALSDIEY